MPTSVALGTYFETFVKAQIASGRYNNVSEVVREGLRLLEDQQQEKQARLESLRTDIDRGLEGPFHSADEVFGRVREKIQAAAQRKAAG